MKCLRLSKVCQSLVFAIGSFWILNSAVAQFPSPTTKQLEKEKQDAATLVRMQQSYEADQRTIASILKKFRPVFPSTHLELLSEDRVQMIWSADFNAFADYDRRRILIPSQFVAEAVEQLSAYILLQRDPKLRRLYNNYYEFLSKRSREALLRILKGETITDDIPLPSFWAFAQIPQPAAFTEDEMWILEINLEHGLALILGHELGHLVLDHKPYQKISPKESQKQEFAADAFAAQLVKAAGMQVSVGVGLFFTRFARNEALANEALVKGEVPGASTHPSAICREYRLLKNYGLPQLLDGTPDQREEIERALGIKLVVFQQKIEELKKDCSS